MIQVTKTFLPPIKEYQAMLQRAWDKQWLTNRGELVLELEDKLKSYLQVPHIICTNNGTVPLQIALELFGKEGEIITTPFSYVATTAAIVWQHCSPVFVDIHPEYLTIDERLIEAVITPKTTAILATHVFGNPCAVEDIDRIAKKHGLKIIYDAAHCFGVQYKGQSILNYGDVSTLSFHATKLFHTGEGGSLCFFENEYYNTFFYSHNFGHKNHVEYQGLGVNGKMSELQAAMGLAVLPYINQILQRRKQVVDYYDQHLNFDKLQKLKLREGTNWNYSYYPILFETEEKLLRVELALNAKQIYPRRYFYPGLNTLPFVKSNQMPVSDSVYKRVLCLPLSHELKKEAILLIAKTINIAS
jgi:dTDP-4-amino-4,6-dideoxygalactose transaminase